MDVAISCYCIMKFQINEDRIKMENATEKPYTDEEEEEEIKSLQQIIKALKFYRLCSYVHINKNEKFLNSLTTRHQNILKGYRQHLSSIRDCCDKNQDVLNEMLRERTLCTVLGERVLEVLGTLDGEPKVRRKENDKTESTLKLIARDWSAACAEEREQSYKPIIDAIEEFFKPEECEPNEIKILVPGAGLGRLTYELACRGYECEGNEFSYFMLIASNFLLNQCTIPNGFTIYPWVHQYVNNLHANDQITAVTFPDISPAKKPPKGKIMMAAGDFTTVYKIPNSYHCVATCFFIDCANNIVEFIEIIYRILVPGGIWVNLGPLLYHYSDVQEENSIEPTYDQLIPIIETVGFEIVRTKTGVRTKYAQNPQSMLKSEYESLFWICRKPINAAGFNNESKNQVLETNDVNGIDSRNEEVADGPINKRL